MSGYGNQPPLGPALKDTDLTPHELSRLSRAEQDAVRRVWQREQEEEEDKSSPRPVKIRPS